MDGLEWKILENSQKNGLITGGAPKMETSMGGWEDQGKPTRKDLKTWGKHLVSSKPGDRKKNDSPTETYPKKTMNILILTVKGM